MTLTRHTQVEDLANLLALRRRQALTRTQRDQAYRRLVATILAVPVDRLDTPRLPDAPTRLRESLRPVPTRRGQAA